MIVMVVGNDSDEMRWWQGEWSFYVGDDDSNDDDDGGGGDTTLPPAYLLYMYPLSIHVNRLRRCSSHVVLLIS